MQKTIGLVIALSLVMIPLSGCREQNIPADAVQENSVQSDSGQQPHQYGEFQGVGKEFNGGNIVSGYNLSSVRRVPNPKLVRLVFEFTQGETGNSAEVPPKYAISLDEEGSRVVIKLSGVEKSDGLKDKQGILGLSSLLKDINISWQADSEAIIELDLHGAATFQVFDLGDPARVVVVLKPQTDNFDKL